MGESTGGVKGTGLFEDRVEVGWREQVGLGTGWSWGRGNRVVWGRMVGVWVEESGGGVEGTM